MEQNNGTRLNINSQRNPIWKNEQRTENGVYESQSTYVNQEDELSSLD